MTSKEIGSNKLAIVGGGQLGMMLRQAAYPLGVEVAVLDSSGVSAQQVGAALVEGSIQDPMAVKRLAEKWGKDAPITIEVEHVAIQALKELHEGGFSVHPNPETMDMIADKLTQKRYLRSHGIPVSDFQEIRGASDVKTLLKKWDAGLVVKARSGGFDGRGNAVVRDPSDLATEKVEKLLSKGNVYAEKIVPFENELALIVVRDTHGNTAKYPVVETIHKDNICHMVISPAQISKDARERVEQIGLQTLDTLKGAGVFAIEMFRVDDDTILVNEIAPRVHNSGHLTIEANKASQFENHVRAVTGRSLGSTEMVTPNAVMINILEGKGKHEPNTIRVGQQGYLHWYGKEGRMPPQDPRKIGHVTGLGNTPEEAMNAAQVAYNQAMEGII